MNCQDALELLYDIIDKEAADVDVVEIKNHLDNCRHCLEVYRLEQSVQQFIDEKLKDEKDSKMPSAKLESLRQNITGRLDEIDKSDVSCSIEKKSFFTPARMMLAAAALVLFVGGGYMTARFVKHYNYYDALETAHMGVIENQASLVNSTDIAAELSDKYNYSIVDNIAGFELAGSQKANLMGQSMNHLVYRNDDKIVSMFVIPSEAMSIPGDLKNNPINWNGLTYFEHECHGCRLVYQVIGDVMVVTASSDHSIKLTDFINNGQII